MVIPNICVPMTSETRPAKRDMTNYEDLPARFRKVWKPGNKEEWQKRLDIPVENASTSEAIRPSTPNANKSEPGQPNTSRSSSQATSRQSSPLSNDFHIPKRPKTSKAHLLQTVGNEGGEDGFLERVTTEPSLSTAQSRPSSLRQAVDAVVVENVARAARSASRSHSPPVDPGSRYSRYRDAWSRPATRASSPASGTRSSTPVPSGWKPLTSRHSLRRFDIRPCGPRHLEYDYNIARKEFQIAAYNALSLYGYKPPKGAAKRDPPPSEQLPSMSDLRKVPEFAKACKKLDAADQALEEALARGETWENTHIPDHYLRLSLEDAIPGEFCVRRHNNTAPQNKHRSSVTLEEAAGQMKPSFFSQSSTAPSSVPSSASSSERSTESMAGDEAKSSRSAPSVIQNTSSKVKDEYVPLPSPQQSNEKLSIGQEDQDGRVNPTPKLGKHPSNTKSPACQSNSGRKRSLEEVEAQDTEDEVTGTLGTGTVDDGAVATRPNTPAQPSGKTGTETSERTETESAFGSGSGSAGGSSARESPPTSIASDASKKGTSSVVRRPRPPTRTRARGRGGTNRKNR